MFIYPTRHAHHTVQALLKNTISLLQRKIHMIQLYPDNPMEKKPFDKVFSVKKYSVMVV